MSGAASEPGLSYKPVNAKSILFRIAFSIPVISPVDISPSFFEKKKKKTLNPLPL